jgi:ABC-type uncharacterized transport system substrate-binding protein
VLKFSIKHVALLLCLLFLSFSISSYAKNIDEIIIITPSYAKPYQEIYKNIERGIIEKGMHYKVKVVSLNVIKQSQAHHFKNSNLVIPIGTKAIDYYIQSNINIPFIASFTTESAFASISKTSHSKKKVRKVFMGGVSLDQPTSRLAYLAKLIKPNISSLGAVIGPNSEKKGINIQRQSARIGVTLNKASIRSKDNPVSKLRDILRKSQLLIVFPDKANFNRSLARWIIPLSYKYQVPVISYSKKYVEAGTLISLYSEPKQIGKQTAEISVAYLKHKYQPRKLLAPKYFNLAINASVKQALNLNFPSKDILLKKLQRIAP